MRVMTGRTYRGLLERAEAAGQVPGLEAQVARLSGQADGDCARIGRLNDEIAGLLTRVQELEQRLVQADAQAEQHRQAAQDAHREAENLRTERSGLHRAVRDVARTPAEVFLVFHRGRLHSAHATEPDARRAAETAPDEPAPRGGWSGWRPTSGELTLTGWELRRVRVHGLLAGVQDVLTGVHGTPDGVHGGGTDG